MEKKQSRRGILKSLLAAPVAAISFNKVKAEEKPTFNHIDLDERLPELPHTGIASSSGMY